MNHSVQRVLTTGFASWVVLAAFMSFYIYKYGKESIRFGIDLVGGTYITLEVQQDDVVKSYLGDKVSAFEAALKSAKLEADSKPTFMTDGLLFKFSSINVAREAKSVFESEEKFLKYN